MSYIYNEDYLATCNCTKEPLEISVRKLLANLKYECGNKKSLNNSTRKELNSDILITEAVLNEDYDKLMDQLYTKYHHLNGQSTPDLNDFTLLLESQSCLGTMEYNKNSYNCSLHCMYQVYHYSPFLLAIYGKKNHLLSQILDRCKERINIAISVNILVNSDNRIKWSEIYGTDKDKHRYTFTYNCIQFAIYHNRLEQLALIINTGYYNSIDDCHPIRYAHSVEIINMLIDGGLFDPDNDVDDAGKILLNQNIHSDNLDIVKKLLDLGLSIEFETNKMSNNHKRKICLSDTLILLVKYNQLAMFRLILDHLELDLNRLYHSDHCLTLLRESLYSETITRTLLIDYNVVPYRLQHLMINNSNLVEPLCYLDKNALKIIYAAGGNMDTFGISYHPPDELRDIEIIHGTSMGTLIEISRLTLRKIIKSIGHYSMLTAVPQMGLPLHLSNYLLYDTNN